MFAEAKIRKMSKVYKKSSKYRTATNLSYSIPNYNVAKKYKNRNQPLYKFECCHKRVIEKS